MIVVTAPGLILAMAGLNAPQDGPRSALAVKAAKAQTFYCDPRAGNSQVTLFSESTLEDFTGVCNEVDGEYEFDPRHVEALRGRFVVRVADIDTGIALRDEHMRSADWLDATGHPQVILEVDRAGGVQPQGDNLARLDLVGRLTLHGRTREVTIPASVVYLDESAKTQRRVKGDLIRIRAGFEIKLSDYGIVGPPGSDAVGLKVADTIELKVTVFGSTLRPPDKLKPDDAEDGVRPRLSPPRRDARPKESD